MNERAILMVIADAAVSPGAVIFVIILLAIIVLGVSLWLFNLRVKSRRALLAQREIVVKRCPNCNALIDPGASFCPSCGSEVPQVTTLIQ